MTTSCVRQTDLPHTTKLFADFLYSPDRLSRFYPYLPLNAESFRAAAEQIQFPTEQRRALVEAFAGENPGSPLLEPLSRPNTVAVVTGQQVGLFTGPAYTIFKALTAIKLAAHLNESGIDAVPVFWLATEDHDLDEVNQCWIFGDPVKPELCRAEVAEAGDARPVGGVYPSAIPLEMLRSTLERLPYGEDVVEKVRAGYSGASFGTGFGKLLRAILADFPILQLDPLLPAFRKLAAPFLRSAVERMPDLVADLQERGQELTAAGYHAQVKIEGSTSLVFLLDNSQRVPLRRSNGMYSSAGRRFTVPDLASQSESLSPNALLRPVVQDSMLPTIAYVGGPSELAYLAQSEVLYRDLLGRQPIAVPRSGFTILDEQSARTFKRYGLELHDLFGGMEAFRQKAAAAVVDRALLKHIAQARESALSSLAGMSAQVERFDPSLSKSVTRSAQKIAYQFEKIERKAAREALRRNSAVNRQVEELFNLAFPMRHLQERFYSILPFLAKHGPGLVSRLYEQISLDCADHQVIVA